MKFSFLFSSGSSLGLLLLPSAAAFFAPASSKKNNNCRSRTTVVQYRNHEGSGGGGDYDGPPTGRRRGTQLTLPVLGPWVERAPLLPGWTMELIDPTPMQYQSLQLAVDKQQRPGGGNNGKDDSDDLLAAPIVAILDQYTAHAPDPGRYATLAAVLGYTERSKGTPTAGDGEYFMDDIIRGGGGGGPNRRRHRGRGRPPMEIPQGERSVRLLGVGRALLTNMCYESTKQNAMDEEGYLLECEVDVDNAASCDNTVIVGSVHVVQDHYATVAPVRAIAECAALLEKVGHWHRERQRLVRQIVNEDDLYQDLDGIGGIFANHHNFLPLESIVDGRTNNNHHIGNTPRSHLERLDNFGLGASASAISSIADLTNGALQSLSPFYSPGLLATEDFYYQMGSWAALAALQSYVQPPHLAWAVRCTDTTERLTALEDWMHSHVKLLRQCVAATSTHGNNNNNNRRGDGSMR